MLIEWINMLIEWINADWMDEKDHGEPPDN